MLPGDRLGVSEEYLPGDGTFQDDDIIYACVTGNVDIDMKERKISVKQTTRKPIYPQRNDVVLGEIQHVSKKSAVVNIFRIGDQADPVAYSGFIFIKNAAGGYVEQMQDLFSPGDVIIARIQSQSDGRSRLSTVGTRFGVLHARCGRCGEPLYVQGRRLECFECGNIEDRKISSNYGKILSSEKPEEAVSVKEK